MANQEKVGVLLLAHGSPDNVSDIPEFLLQVTGGRPLPANVVDEVRHRYSLIGRSPLTAITLKQGADLQRELQMPVYVGMRNWHPFIADAVAKMMDDSIQRAIVICLAPQNSRTSVGLYRRALESKGSPPFATDFVDNWHDHPLLIRAFADRLKAGHDRACRAAGTKVPVVFTAHSVPQRTIAEGDPYEAQAKETAAMVAMETPSLSIDDWRFAFQSQGMSGGTWLGPTVEDTILDLQRQGHRGVFIQPIGFLCDHVEVLYDVDIAFRQFAEKQGMQLWRAQSLNDSPLLIAALADVVRSRMSPETEEKPPLVNIKTVQ